MFGFLTDAWLGLASLDPAVRTAALLLFAAEVTGAVTIRWLTSREAPVPAASVPVEDPRPDFRKAA